VDLNIDLISTFSIIAPVVIGAIFYFKLHRTLKVLCWLLFATLILEGAGVWLFELKINNLFIFHLYSYIEFGLITLIYYQLSTNQMWKRLMIVIFVLFLLYSGIVLLFYQGLDSFNSLQRNAEGVILMVYFFTFIRDYSLFGSRKRALFKSFFWLTYGYFIYFAGTLFLFVFANEILSDRMNDYWIIHGIFNIFLNITYAVVLISSLRSRLAD
jgi:hypothetical protein